jgi:hypothetical protein
LWATVASTQANKLQPSSDCLSPNFTSRSDSTEYAAPLSFQYNTKRDGYNTDAPTISFDPATKRPQTYALDRAATGIGSNYTYSNKIFPGNQSRQETTVFVRLTRPIARYDFIESCRR